MTGSTRRLWFAVHSWLGLTCGLLLLVVCWSGTLAVFSHEIDWLIDQRLRAQSPPAEVRWQAIADAVEARYPNWRIVEINAPRRDGFAVEVLAEPVADRPQRIYVDPRSAQVLGRTSFFNVQRFFRSFHMSLFDTGRFTVLGVPLGYFVVAVVSLPLLASMASSLVFYRRWWRACFTITIGKGARAFWSSAHKLAGVWSLWFIIVIGGTGAWYLAEWYVPYGEDPEPPRQVANGPALSLDALVAKAETAYPGLNVTGISGWVDGPVVAISGRDGSFLVRDGAASAIIHRQSGVVSALHRPSEMGLLDRWMETVDPVHFGTWGGLGSQLLYFVFGLGLSSLALTGAYLHAQRQQRLRGPMRVRGPVLAAYLATLVLVGFSVWSGYQEIRGYGLEGRFPDVPPGAVLVIGLWCFSTIASLCIWIGKLRG